MAEQISFSLSNEPVPRVLFFDLETLRSADEVGGWGNIHNMGMSCGVVYDRLDSEFRTYEEKDVPSLIEDLKQADLVVGFNHIRFDYTVLKGYSSYDFRLLPSFDILDDIKRILGHRLRLNSLVASTLGESKSADGLQSLRWVKEGRLDLVRDYCRQDVEVTRSLFEHGAHKGEVRYEKDGVLVPIPVNWDINRLIRKAKEEITKIRT